MSTTARGAASGRRLTPPLRAEIRPGTVLRASADPIGPRSAHEPADGHVDMAWKGRSGRREPRTRSMGERPPRAPHQALGADARVVGAAGRPTPQIVAVSITKR
ncbi:hypothetical protein OH828_36950 [Streptomyces anulatus]|uniref:hypothetical protein n=1 Tax=Streptomyces anulatus TaxID=1892 RepID=UPI00386493A3|nr:hypothetical protein OH791_37265 [Streptomyces anulatus]